MRSGSGRGWPDMRYFMEWQGLLYGHALGLGQDDRR